MSLRPKNDCVTSGTCYMCVAVCLGLRGPDQSLVLQHFPACSMLAVGAAAHHCLQRRVPDVQTKYRGCPDMQGPLRSLQGVAVPVVYGIGCHALSSAPFYAVQLLDLELPERGKHVPL